MPTSAGPSHVVADDGHHITRHLRRHLSFWGGFTLHPETKEQPDTGFAVCTDSRLSKNIAWDAWDNGHVTRWLHSLASDLRRGSNFLGGWLERGPGRVWLEVVVVVPADQRSRAIRLASRAGQRAVYDLERRTVVPVPHPVAPHRFGRGSMRMPPTMSCDVR